MITEGKRHIWKEYQKKVADDRYYYARSCVIQDFSPASEQPFLKMMLEEPGKEVFDDPLLDNMGIAYDRSRKHSGSDGQKFGSPSKPTLLKVYGYE